MPLQISTTNTTGLDLVATVDQVSAVGAALSPQMRWDPLNEEFIDVDEFADPTDAYITLTESNGLYEETVSMIDALTENLKIVILDRDTNTAIGVSTSLVTTFASPEVIIDLNVTEDRS